MDDRLRRRHRFVNLKMQQNLAGLWTIPAYLAVLQIHQRKIIHTKIAFAAQRGRAQNIMRRQANGNIAAVSVDILPLPKLLTHAHNLFLQRVHLRGVENLQRIFCIRLARSVRRKALQHGTTNNGRNIISVCVFHGVSSAKSCTFPFRHRISRRRKSSGFPVQRRFLGLNPAYAADCPRLPRTDAKHKSGGKFLTRRERIRACFEKLWLIQWLLVLAANL